MLHHLKSSFVWQFTAGFVLGAIGVFALQPADARAQFAHHAAPTHIAR